MNYLCAASELNWMVMLYIVQDYQISGPYPSSNRRILDSGQSPEI
jgi:hypothetical protein